MKNRPVVLLLVLALSVSIFSGCGNKAAVPEEVKPAETAETEDTKKAETAAAEAENADTEKEDTGKNGADPAVTFDPASLVYGDRFLAGKNEVFYIEDDASLSPVFSCEDGSRIEFAGGGDSVFFIVTVDGHMKYKLNYLKKGGSVAEVSLDAAESTGLNNKAVYEDRFYFDCYDQETESFPILYFDPERGIISEDTDLENLIKNISAYQGRELQNIDYNIFAPKELARSGRLYMKEAESSLIYAFDKEGKELSKFDPIVDIGTWSIFEDKYLFGRAEESKENGRKTEVYHMIFDAETGKNTVIYDNEENETGFEIEDIKDGYVYYFLEEKDKDGTVINRKYLREKLENFDSSERNGEEIVDIPVWTGVEANYGPEYMRGFNAFSVKGNRVYYLCFDGSGEEGHKGDVVWEAVDLDRAGSDDSHIVTNAVERHEYFADYGTLTTTRDAREEQGITYFKGGIDRFTFNKDIENADKLNAILDEKYEEYKGASDSVADYGHDDIFGPESSYDLEEAWVPTYGYDVSMGGIEEIAPGYVELTLNIYAYYGGAHGMPEEDHWLFDLKQGKTVDISELYKGTEEEFKAIVLKHSMDTWKSGEDNRFYENYDPALESDKEKEFAECIDFSMTIDYSKDGLSVLYPPYAVGPYASGFIDIFIPYSELGIEF